jgi:hypothetical protein
MTIIHQVKVDNSEDGRGGYQFLANFTNRAAAEKLKNGDSRYNIEPVSLFDTVEEFRQSQVDEKVRIAVSKLSSTELAALLDAAKKGRI